MPEQKPIKVAIVGGGCAAMTAAFELTRPEHHGKFQVTVYQLGWRLGGKGASGRGPAGRIEEHGFHVWFGFYENAFRIMRECYAELNRDPRKCRIARWQDAFFPAPFVGFANKGANGAYSTFTTYFPPGEGLPGDPVTEDHPFGITTYLMRAASLLRMMVMSVQTQGGKPQSKSGPPEHTSPEAAGDRLSDPESAGDIQARIARLIKYGSMATVAGLIEAVGVIELVFRAVSFYPSASIMGLLEATLAGARRQLEALVESDPRMLFLWQAIELVLTVMLGIMRFGLIWDPRGFDAINDYEFREWMRINGASERTLQSPLVRACYDLSFAYEDGDYRRPSHGAGVGLRGTSRMLFTYRGAPFWKMSAGMGDVVFGPLYEVLKRRGVSFQFFHRLENVKIAAGSALSPGERPYVEELQFDVQALVKGGGEYQPLVDFDGLPCWPSKPDYSQLVDGYVLEREQRKFESHWDRRKVATKNLRVSEDFDFVVLGIGLGAIPYVCRELVERDQRWRDMVTHVKTVETQAIQLWLSEDMESLGWTGPSVSMCGFVQPFESWCDMRHLVKEERWLGNRGSVAYFLSTLKDSGTPPLSDPGYPARRNEEVRQNAIRFLNNDLDQLWPGAARSGRFRWDILRDPEGRQANGPADESRFDSQYWIANVDPTERYVVSVAGSQKYRISPLDNTYDNLTIAGDWTASGLDSGCVESAVMSGRLAAHALSSLPALEDIVGYDHP